MNYIYMALSLFLVQFSSAGIQPKNDRKPASADEKQCGTIGRVRVSKQKSDLSGGIGLDTIQRSKEGHPVGYFFRTSDEGILSVARAALGRHDILVCIENGTNGVLSIDATQQ